MQSSTRLGNWNISTIVGNTPTGVVIAKQVHGNTVIPVSSWIDTNTIADGLIGIQDDKPFGIRTADCMPLVLATKERVVGLHISRKTLVAGILEETRSYLRNNNIEEAYIGPHICESCFTFSYKGEGIQQFEKLFPYATETGDQATYLSLVKVVMQFLEENLVLKENIQRDERCTFENPELPSYRRWITEGNTGPFPQITTVIR